MCTPIFRIPINPANKKLKADKLIISLFTAIHAYCLFMLLFINNTIFPFEFVYASAGVNQFLLPCKERMAL